MTLNVSNNVAFIIVDPQVDFCPGGNLAVEGGDKIMAGINAIKLDFETVIITQDFHPVGHKSFASAHDGKASFETIEMPYGVQVLWPDHCVQGTEGVAFHPDFIIDETDMVLQKGMNPDVDSYSGFYENDKISNPRFANGETLTDTLINNLDDAIVLAGLAYDYCVGWHALDAKKEGFHVIVAKHLSRAISPDTEAAMDQQLADAGVIVVNNDEKLQAALDQFANPEPSTAAKPEQDPV